MPTTKMKQRPTAKLRSRKIAGSMKGCLSRRQGEGVHEEEIEGERRQIGFDTDFGGGEPVELLAAVEHHLECADGDRELAKPNQSSDLRVFVSVK